MLSESSYWFAIYTYLIAGALFSLYFVYLARSWLSARFRVPFFLFLLALFLTPAYSSNTEDTMAPALIVAGFRILTYGIDSAAHAIRPLVFTIFISLVVSIFYLLLKAHRSTKSSK